MSSETVIREPSTNVESITLAGEQIALTPFCTYKFQEACRLLGQMVERFGVKELLDSLAGLPEEPTAVQQLYVFAPLLPKLTKELPDAVREFVAVCSVPDKRLEELYDEQGGIAAEVQRQSKRLLFQSTAAEVTHALAAFLRCLEVEALKNELGQVAEAFSGLMRPQEQKKSGRKAG